MPITVLPNYEAEMAMHTQNIFSQLLSNMMLQRMAQSFEQKKLDLDRQQKEQALQATLLIHGIPSTSVAGEAQPQQEQGLLGKLFGSMLGQGPSASQTPALNTATNEFVNQQFGMPNQPQAQASAQPPASSGQKVRIGNIEATMPADSGQVQVQTLYAPGPNGQQQLLGHYIVRGKEHAFHPAKDAGDMTTDKQGAQWVSGRTDELVGMGIPKLRAQGIALSEFYQTRGPIVPMGSFDNAPGVAVKGAPGQIPSVVPAQVRGNMPQPGPRPMDAGVGLVFGQDGKPITQSDTPQGPPVSSYKPPGAPFPTGEEEKELSYLKALKATTNELKATPNITKHTGPFDYTSQSIANTLNLDPDNFASNLLGGKSASPEAATVYAKLAGLYRMVYGESGKQINEQELKKLQERMPTKWTSDTDFYPKLNEFDKILDQMHEARVNSMEAGGKRNAKQLRDEYEKLKNPSYGSVKKLTVDVAREYLRRAGGDQAKAKAMAAQDGWSN